MHRRAFLKVASMGVVGVGLGTYMHGENEYNSYRSQAPMADSTTLALADGFVVFTGSSGRIEEGLRICQPQQKLHVSGCDPMIKSVDFLLNAFPVKNSNVLRENITIDYARNTSENGQRTREWLEANTTVNKLVVVTSDFHIPRAYSLVRNALQSLDRHVDFSMHAVQSAPNLTVSFKERLKLIQSGAENLLGMNGPN